MSAADVSEGLPQGSLRARALLLGARLELRNWPEAEALARMPLAVRLPSGGVDIVALIAFDIVLVLYGMWRG